MAALAASLPRGGRLVVQVDVDAFDPAVAPGVNAPAPGGFRFEEVACLVRAAIAANGLAGLSVVELVPARDPSGSGAAAAARLILNAEGAACRRGACVAGRPGACRFRTQSDASGGRRGARVP